MIKISCYKMDLWIVGLILAFQQVYFTQGNTTSDGTVLPIDYQAEFSWNLYRKIFSKSEQPIVISPYSLRKIFACLQQLTDSNEPNTATLKKELNQVFKLKQNNELIDLVRQRYANQWTALQQESGFNITTLAAVIDPGKVSKRVRKLTSSCGIFTRSLKPASPKLMTRTFNGIMRNVANSTVKRFLGESDIDPDWDFFVADSWKFKGLWKYEFQKSHSTICNFYANATTKGLMRFMYLEEMLKYGYFPDWHVRAVELPLHGTSPFSCLLLMPVKRDIEFLINTLNHERFKNIYSSMFASKTTVRLPQFKYRMKMSAKSVLRQLGFNAAFDKSSFRVFDQKTAVPLGDVIQKVEISMDHEGEQSANMYLDRSMGNQFTAHQPFVFVIFARKELTPVIIGHLVKPLASENIKSASDERLCDNPP